MLLQEIARAIERDHPEASTFDESPVRHVQVAEIVIAKTRGRAENRRNVVVLRDSITRLARADQHVLPPGKGAARRRGQGRGAGPYLDIQRAGTRKEQLLLPQGMLDADARSGGCARVCIARRGRSLERLRSGMIQTESNEAFLAILRSPGRAAAIRQRAH